MSTELVPIDALVPMARSLALSRLFGDKKEEQILALLMLAHAEGVHPMTAMRDFDIINGRPAKKAEAMHRSFIDAGGSIEWHTLDDTKADATFSHPHGGKARIVWDMDRVKKAEIKNDAMYKKYPRQMLRSRCISEGCRTVFPAATSGLYEPGEVRDIEPRNMGRIEPAVDAEAEVIVRAQPQQLITLRKALEESGVTEDAFLEEVNRRSDEANKISEISELAANDVVNAIKWIRSQKK